MGTAYGAVFTGIGRVAAEKGLYLATKVIMGSVRSWWFFP